MGKLRCIIVSCLLGLLVLSGCSRQEAEWREARARDALASYQSYVERYPAGTHVDEARQRMRELQEEREWQRAGRLATPEALQRYLAGHPEGRHAAEARDRLAEFLLQRAPAGDGLPVPAVPAPVTAGWVVQLGAFTSRSAAEEVAARLSSAHRDLLGELPTEINQGRESGQALWRLQVAAPSEALARDWCKELQGRGDACLALAR